MKRRLSAALLAVLVVAADQLTKWLVAAHCTLYDHRVLVPHLLEFYYLHNDGAAMGLFAGWRWVLALVTALLLALCAGFMLFYPFRGLLPRLALALVAGGGVGNLIDRLRLGYVIDFVRFPVSWFPFSFNLADCAVCVGAALLVLAVALEGRSPRPGAQP